MARHAKSVVAILGYVVLFGGLHSVGVRAAAMPAAGQAAGQPAGKVSAAIPDESVQRLGAGPELALKISDPVNWTDVVRTLQAGRMRIELLDGSFLNVGARSIMKIVKHNAQSQQTEIELNLGRMRAQVVHLSRAGASFQVKTPTAVLGVTGTDFIVNVTEAGTEVFVIEGAVVVANILAGVAGQVTLHAGEHVSVASGQAPSAPGQTSQSDLQAQMDQTNVAPPSGGGGGGGGGGAKALSQAAAHGHKALLIGGLAAGGAAAAGAAAYTSQNSNSNSCSTTQVESLVNPFLQACQACAASSSTTSSSCTQCQNLCTQLGNAVGSYCQCLGSSRGTVNCSTGFISSGFCQ